MADLEHDEGRALVVESSTLALLNKVEIDQQISTAKRYPRSVTGFRKEATELVSLNEHVARECVYSLPRKEKAEGGGSRTKLIEGASARFAEIIASSWRNCRAGARVVNQDREFVTAQGVFHDLENNVAVTYEVQRRIVDRNGNRYSVDMIGVTANAACSIALRNAILKGIPKAFWADLLERAKATYKGDASTLAQRRADAIEWFKKKHDITVDKLCHKLGIEGPADIGLDELVILGGIRTAIEEGDTTADEAFALDADETAPLREPRAKKVDDKKDDGSALMTPPVVNPTKLTKQIIKQIELRAEAYGVDINRVKGEFGVEKLEEIDAVLAPKVLQWIEQQKT